MEPAEQPPKKRRLIFVRSFRHHKTGKVIVAKNGGVFAFYVDN